VSGVPGTEGRNEEWEKERETIGRAGFKRRWSSEPWKNVAYSDMKAMKEAEGFQKECLWWPS
jgi:hypothetical protein